MTICVLCQLREATTRDHVPPKCLFPRPRPDNLITVPACAQCNNGASDHDDLFKVFLSMQVSENSEIGLRLFHEKTVRTLERNRALLERIRQESVELQIKNEKGELKTRTGVLWDSAAHDAVISRTIKGLYYHHTGHFLSSHLELKVQYLRGVPEELTPMLDLCSEVTIGNSQILYKYWFHPEDISNSLWLFEFYGAHWASGYTSKAT